MDPAVGFYIANVNSGEYSGISFTAEGYPSAVGRPTVPAFALVAINLESAVLVLTALCCVSKVNHIQVATFLVNWKATIIAHTEQ